MSESILTRLTLDSLRETLQARASEPSAPVTVQ
jgi:hypothetical protein